MLIYSIGVEKIIKEYAFLSILLLVFDCVWLFPCLFVCWYFCMETISWAAESANALPYLNCFVGTDRFEEGVQKRMNTYLALFCLPAIDEHCTK